VHDPAPSGATTLTGDAVAETVARFTDLYGDALAVPAIAHDMCVPVSEAFVQALAESGVAARVLSGVRMGEFNGTPVLLNGHFAVEVGEVVYDWTARQFDEGASVPLVEPVAVWRERWPAL
jgi:hypothetical protein